MMRHSLAASEILTSESSCEPLQLGWLVQSIFGNYPQNRNELEVTSSTVDRTMLASAAHVSDTFHTE